MLTCRDFIEFLADYSAGELPEDRRFDFDSHMAVCPSCIAYLRSYAETIRLGRDALHDLDAPVPGVPDELVASILALRAGGSERS